MKKKSTSNLRLLLIALGSAVGLANIWGFPYKFESGGLAFLIFFILFATLFAVFGLSAELAMGRLVKSGALSAYEFSFKMAGKGNKKMRFIGYIPLAATFFVAVGYSAILAYMLKGFIAALSGNMFKSSADIWFYSYARKPYKVSIHHAIIILITILTSLGNTKTFNKIYRYTMPVFFVILMILAIRVATLPNAYLGYRYMFRYNPSHLHTKTMLYGMGEAFFSLSLSGAAMVAAGSKISDEQSMVNLSVESLVFDTLVGIIASLMIIPAINVFNIENAGGASLLFVALPTIFSNIKFGRILAIFFYFSIVFAGIVALVDMFAGIVNSAVIKTRKLSKKAVLLILGLAVFILGLKLETIDEFTHYMNIMLLHIIPIGASIGAVTWFYILDKDILLEEINKGASITYGDRWYKIGKYLYVPVALIMTILAFVVRFIH